MANLMDSRLSISGGLFLLFAQHRIKVAYGSALLVTALLGLIVYLNLSQSTDIQQNTADAIQANTAQRMQLERATLLLLSLTATDENDQRETHLSELDSLLTSLEQNHAAFIQSGQQEALPPEVARIYFTTPQGIDMMLSDYLRVARYLSETSAVTGLPQRADYQRLFEISPRLQERYNAVILVYDMRHQAEVENLRLLAGVAFVGVLSILALEGLFIFYPMERAIQRQHAQLKEEIQHRKEVEASLRQSEANYRLLAQHLPDMAVLMFSHDLRFTLADGSALERVGHVKERIEGKSLGEVVAPAASQVLEPYYRGALEGHAASLEYTFNGRDYITHFTPVYDDNRHIMGGMVTSQDVTEKRIMEKALQISELRFRMVSEIISDYAYGLEVHPDGRMTSIWKVGAFENITGYTSEEFDEIGGWRTVLFPADLTVAGGRLQRLMAGEDDISEFRIFTKSGQICWLRDYGHPIWDAETQRVTHIFGAAQDITAQKQAEAALKQSEERFRLITETASDLICVIAPDFCFAYVSPSYQTTLGYDSVSVQGKSLFAWIHPDDVGRVQARLQASPVERPLTEAIEFRYRHSDGQYLWLEAQANAIYEGEGVLKNLVLVMRDVTIRRQLQQLQMAQEALQVDLKKEKELSDLKSAMMIRIAHEFRTPLSIILSSTEMLTRHYATLTDEQRTKKKHNIEVQIHHITHMLDDIALVVNGRFVALQLSCIALDLGVVCREATLEVETNLQQQGRFILEIPADMIIHADYSGIYRALYEIFSNAARFSDPASLIAVGAIRLNQWVEIRVSDHGIGIMPEEQLRIFEPFFRGSNINELSGLGLGLTIANAVIQAHGGSLTVESQLNAGTNVTMRLPETRVCP